jgi:type VI secretion system secreted protein Hcp
MDVFLKLDDIKGESADENHKGELDVLTWTFGVSQSGGAHIGSGSGSGKAQVSDLTITKPTCRASPILFSKCTTGAAIGTGLLTVRKAGGKPLEYVKITMNNVSITSHIMGGDGGGDMLTETVSLHFGSVSFEYVPQKADGSGDASIVKGYDITRNKPL